MANTPAYAPRTPADGMSDMPQEAAEPGQIMLDKSNPDIAEAFANCKPGDMYKVVKDDENEVVLETVPQEQTDEEQPPENGGDEPPAGDEDEPDDNFKSDKPAIALLIAKKRKQ